MVLFFVVGVAGGTGGSEERVEWRVERHIPRFEGKVLSTSRSMSEVATVTLYHYEVMFNTVALRDSVKGSEVSGWRDGWVERWLIRIESLLRTSPA